jgi:hypothetical protein
VGPCLRGFRTIRPEKNAMSQKQNVRNHKFQNCFWTFRCFGHFVFSHFVFGCYGFGPFALEPESFTRAAIIRTKVGTQAGNRNFPETMYVGSSICILRRCL